MPRMFTPSCRAALLTSDQTPAPMHSAIVPTAGTVVTEMKTPTRGPDFEVVRERTPATPASSAITNDQMSGLMMNFVSSPLAASSGDTRPMSVPTNHSGAAMARAIRNPRTRVLAARGSSESRGRASARQMAATGENSGPTTIAPTIRIGWSSSRPVPAMSVASVRNEQ